MFQSGGALVLYGGEPVVCSFIDSGVWWGVFGVWWWCVVGTDGVVVAVVLCGRNWWRVVVVLRVSMEGGE